MRAETDLLPQIAAIRPHDIDDNILHRENLRGHERRLREHILLHAVEAAHDAVETADAVICVHDLPVELILDGNGLVKEALQEPITFRRPLPLPPCRLTRMRRAVGEIAREHTDEEIGNHQEQQGRLIEHRDEIRAAAQFTCNQQEQRKHNRRQRLTLAVEQAHRTDVEITEHEGRPALPREDRAGERAYEQRPRHIFQPGNERAQTLLAPHTARRCLLTQPRLPPCRELLRADLSELRRKLCVRPPAELPLRRSGGKLRQRIRQNLLISRLQTCENLRQRPLLRLRQNRPQRRGKHGERHTLRLGKFHHVTREISLHEAQ